MHALGCVKWEDGLSFRSSLFGIIVKRPREGGWRGCRECKFGFGVRGKSRFMVGRGVLCSLL